MHVHMNINFRVYVRCWCRVVYVGAETVAD